MKISELGCTALLLAFAAGDVSASAGRTIHMGQIDPVSERSFLLMLEKPFSGVSQRRATGSPTRQAVIFDGIQSGAAQRVIRSALPPPSYYVSQPTGAARAPAGFVDAKATEKSRFWLMSLLAAGMVLLHLRRKQKSLQHRPLAEVMYR